MDAHRDVHTSENRRKARSTCLPGNSSRTSILVDARVPSFSMEAQSARALSAQPFAPTPTLASAFAFVDRARRALGAPPQPWARSTHLRRATYVDPARAPLLSHSTRVLAFKLIRPGCPGQPEHHPQDPETVGSTAEYSVRRALIGFLCRMTSGTRVCTIRVPVCPARACLRQQPKE